MNEKSKEIKKLSFEEALSELEETVRRLESGNVKLEDAVSAYERGVKLKNHCQSKLAEAKLKIEQITLDKDGNPTGVKPFKAEE